MIGSGARRLTRAPGTVTRRQGVELLVARPPAAVFATQADVLVLDPLSAAAFALLAAAPQGIDPDELATQIAEATACPPEHARAAVRELGAHDLAREEV